MRSQRAQPQRSRVTSLTSASLPNSRRAEAGRGGGFAALDAVARGHGEVGGDLVVEIAIAAAEPGHGCRDSTCKGSRLSQPRRLPGSGTSGRAFRGR